MTIIVTSKTRALGNRAPVGPVSFNRDSTLARGLTNLYPLMGNARDIARSDNLIVTNASVEVNSLFNSRVYDFDGAGDYIKAGNDLGYGGKKQITIAGWVYSDPRPANTEYAFGLQHNTTGGRYTAALAQYNSSAGYNQAFVNDGTTSISYRYVAGVPNGFQWTHRTLCIDINTSHLDYYIDGEPLTEVSTSGTFPVNGLRAGSTFSLGRDDGDAARDLTGKLFMIGVWDRALSSADVRSLYSPQRRFELLWYKSKVIFLPVAAVGGGFQSAWAKGSNVVHGAGLAA